MPEESYQSLIDGPTWDFIARTLAAYPETTANPTILDQRRGYDAMCRQFSTPYPPGVTARDVSVAGVPCREYPGALPTVVYLHGGGFVVGGLDSHDSICADLRHAAGLRVISVDYRLAPEHLHPAAFDDALAVTCAIAATSGPVLLMGDSAGGTLAAAVSHALRGSGTSVLGQVLIYPGLGGDRDTGSYLRHAHAPMLTRDDVLFFSAIRHAGAEPVGDPTATPLQDTTFAGLPPTLAIAAQCDPLADDARQYANQLCAAGSLAHWIEEPGLVHGYLRARTTVPRAAASFARVCTTLTAFAARTWPFGDAS